MEDKVREREKLAGEENIPVEDKCEPEAAGVNPEEPVNLEDIRRQLEEKTALAEENYNRMLRVQADFDNFRRRSRQEREELLKYAAEGLIVNLLPIVDNFERALQSAHNSSDLASFVAGVEMIYRQFKEVLEKEGLAPIEAVGREFDPSKHDAVCQGPGEGQPENTVIEEFQKGYLLGEKVIRPSMVKVAKD